MLVVARSQEIAESILAVFREEADRRSMIESVHEGGRRRSLAEMGGKQDRVHRRNSVDRLQTSERSLRSRNKVLIHQKGLMVLKKANLPGSVKASGAPLSSRQRRGRRRSARRRRGHSWRASCEGIPLSAT